MTKNFFSRIPKFLCVISKIIHCIIFTLEFIIVFPKEMSLICCEKRICIKTICDYPCGMCITKCFIFIQFLIHVFSFQFSNRTSDSSCFANIVQTLIISYCNTIYFFSVCVPTSRRILSA